MKNSTLLYGKVNHAISKASIRRGKSLVLLLLFFLTLGAKANPVDMGQAREIGAKFINGSTSMRTTASSLRHITTYRTDNNVAAFYVFNTSNGFVIVAADDCSTPILAYSDEGPFNVDNIPVQMEGYLQVYRKEIQYGIEHRVSGDESIAKQWNMLRTTGKLYGTRTTTSVEPLLSETWNQNCYYNALCPEDADGPCGHVYAGCVATAMGQIMHFWQYPVVGSGSHTYYPDGYPQQTANFGATTYDWMNMPNDLNSSSSSTQINAVATLLWHCGIAVNMMYSASGSGAYSSDVPYALTEYFNYSDVLYGQYKEDNYTWLSMVKSNLDMGLPLYYSGSDVNGGGGHAFVCDGYDANDYLHFNWGWSGSGNNAYFAVDALNVGDYQFNNYNYAIFNIRPQTGDTYQITAEAYPAEGGTVSGGGTYYEGHLCTLTAVSGYDYNFVNWTKDGVVVSTDPTYSFMVTEDATYVANFALFEGITIGSGTATNEYLPSYSYYCYTLSEQIYTSDDLDMPGAITSLAFYNAGETKTRTYNIYIVNTEKTNFENSTDWITPTEEDLMFSGTVTMTSGMWTTFVLDNPFVYDGTNFALIVDDNTGSWTGSPHMACRVFSTENMQAMRIYSDGTDYDPFNPTQYVASATYYEKNQIRITMESLTASTPMVNPDPIDLGYRPNGAWMPPYTFNLYNPGYYTTINSMSSTNPYFQLDTEGLDFPFNLGYHGNRDIKVNYGTGGGQINGLLNINYGDNENVQYNMTAHAYTPVSPDVWEMAEMVTDFPYTANLNSTTIPLYDNYRLPPTSIADGADAVYKLVFTEDTYLNASVTNGEDGKVALYPEGFYGEGGPDLNNNYTAPETPIEDWLYYDNGEYYESWYTNWGDCIWGIKFSPDQLAAYANCNLTKISVFDSNSNYGLSTYTMNIYVGGNTPDEGILVHTQDFEPYVDNTFHEVFLTEPIDIDPSQNLWITLHAQANGGYPIACCRNVEDPNGRWYYYDSSWTEFTGYNDAAWMIRGFVTNASGRTIALGNRDETIDVTIGDESSTTTVAYSPFHTLWNYSLSETLFLASELAEAGMTTAPISKLSWFVSSTSCTTPQNGISIWMANVPDTELTDTSHTIESMTLVYTGENILPTVGQWNEFVFNEGSFAWDGISNVLILCQRNNGSWQGSVSWQTHNPGFTAMCYAYSDTNGGYDANSQTYSMYTSSTNRPNTRFTLDNIFEGTITNMTVTPGTYYLVASSTSNEWSLEINADEVPCPAPAYSPFPANYAEVNPERTIELNWHFGQKTTEYKLMFGTTENCEQTLVDWTRELRHYYTLPALLDETTYYWKIVERNDGCSEGVESPVWSFTTRLNTPQNLYAEEEFIMEGSSAVLYWSAPARALLSYNVYQDGVLIGNTTDTYYVVDGLTYNMNGYAFYVTGVFDAGESDPSNYTYVYVSGMGSVNGHVYEQDGDTGIENATVTFVGYDEYGYYNTYSFITDAEGYYEGSLKAGSYNAMASCRGYQDKYYNGSVGIMFNTLTEGIDITLDELFNPVSEVVAEYYPDAQDPSSPYVKVHWGFDNPSNWLYYDDGIYVTSIGTNGGVIYWASMFPAASIAPYIGKNLTKVALYENDYNTDEMTVLIYLGGDNAPQTLVSTMNYNPVGGDAFHEVTLTSPVVIDGTQNLWIVFSEYGTYPANACTDAGEVNNRWVSLDGAEWMDVASAGVPGYGWMIRGFVSNGAGRGETMISNNMTHTDQQYANVDIAHRNVQGNGVLSTASNVTPHNVGTPATMDMEEINRSFQYYRIYRTNAYNNGPYTVDNTVLLADNVTDSLLIDITWQNAETGVYKWGVSCVYEGNRESEISWGELNQLNPMPNRSSRQHQAIESTTRENLVYDFDDGSLQGWTTIDADGDGYTWVSSATPGVYHNSGIDLTGTGHNSSAHYVISASWANGLGQVLYPDNYMVSPQIALGGSISFWACAQDASYAADHFGVAVSTSSNTNPNTFVTIQEWTMTAKGTSDVMSFGRNDNTRSQGNWYQYIVDLSAYAGQNGYVAIRHFNCSDQFILNIDDVEITASSIQIERESAITWSNFLDKDMYLDNGEVNLTVTLNSGDNPVGTMVSFTNLNSNEQQLYPVADIILDGTGYYSWDSFRRGDYQVTLTKEGYATLTETVSIWDATSLSYILEETTQMPTNLYVSSTGWAKWNGMGEDLNQIVSSNSFSVDFEEGVPEGWTTIDADGDSYNWVLGSQIGGIYLVEGTSLAGSGHNASADLICSGSYSNVTNQAITPDNYLVSPQVTLAAGSTFSFWACAQDAGWASEHFGVAVSENGTSNWIMVQEWTMTAKSGGNMMSFGRGGNTRAQGNWYQYTVDLSAYAGQKYIAIRHFNCTDMFILDVDDIELTSGRNGGRHYEYNQVVLTDMQNNVLYTENTPNKYCQLPVDNLVEGNTYHCKVASVYSSGMTEWAEVDWVYQACDNYEGASNLTAETTEEGNLISWTYPIIEGDGNRDEWIFFNGYVTDAGAMDNGADASWIKDSQSAYGPGCQLTNGNRVGDSFTLSTATTLTEIEVYGYQTGSSTTSTFDGLYAQIYDGNPMNGGQVVWGDANTNIMTATAFTNCYRGSDGDASGTTRPIMSITSSGLNIGLDAGTYYLVYSLTGTGSSGPWGAPHAEPGVGNTGNGIQWHGSSSSWQNMTDGGAGTPYGISFRLRNGNNTISTIGAMVYRDNELVGFTSESSYLDAGETGNHQYTIRMVYGGLAICPDNNVYYSMSCPQSTSIDEENHWNVDIHEYPYNMSITGIIEINGVEQQTNALEIGAFCNGECRGSQRLTYFPQVDRYLVFFTLYGDAGDVMSFRLYDHAVGEELDLSCSSTISFVPDGFMGTAFDPYVFNFNMSVDQVTNFAQGYNWWGTYIEQSNIDGLGMLQEGLGDCGVSIRSQVGFIDYYQGYGWYGSLSSINNESSYKVITNAPCTVTMTGDAAVPSQHPITLGPGWTWIGYVPSTGMSVDAAMAGMDATQGDKLKSQQGYSDYYPGYGWFGSLNTIEPGMGLMYYSTSSNPVTFTYPDSGRGGELKRNITAENNHWVPNVYAYHDNMTVMAVVDLNDVELNSEHYELAAFTANGECRGSVKLTYAEPLHRYVAFLTISGKDATELSFRLYNAETNEEYYDAEESLDFMANAIVGEADDLYTIHFRGATRMDEFANRVQVYPNPVNAGERFSIGMANVETYPVHVEIVNALGVETLRATSVQTPVSIVAPATSGVYTLRITVKGKGTVVRKLVVK